MYWKEDTEKEQQTEQQKREQTEEGGETPGKGGARGLGSTRDEPDFMEDGLDSSTPALSWLAGGRCLAGSSRGGKRENSSRSQVSSYKDTGPIGSGSHPYDLINLNFFHKGPISKCRDIGG